MTKYAGNKDLLLYIDNKSRRACKSSKYGKYNYRVLKIGTLQTVDGKLKYTDCPFDDRLLISLRDSKKE